MADRAAFRRKTAAQMAARRLLRHFLPKLRSGFRRGFSGSRTLSFGRARGDGLGASDGTMLFLRTGHWHGGGDVAARGNLAAAASGFRSSRRLAQGRRGDLTTSTGDGSKAVTAGASTNITAEGSGNEPSFQRTSRGRAAGGRDSECRVGARNREDRADRGANRTERHLWLYVLAGRADCRRRDQQG